MVDMNNTNIVHTGHYHNFRPYQVDIEDMRKSSRGRESTVYTPEVLSLLKNNLNKWFVIQEVKFDRADRKSIMSKRSTFYQSSKIHSFKISNLEYMVRGESKADTHTLRLLARLTNENQ